MNKKVVNGGYLSEEDPNPATLLPPNLHLSQARGEVTEVPSSPCTPSTSCGSGASEQGVLRHSDRGEARVLPLRRGSFENPGSAADLSRNDSPDLVHSSTVSFLEKSVEKARYWDLKTAAAYVGISVNALRKRIRRESMDVIQRAPGCRIELTQEMIDEHKRRSVVRKLRRSVNSSVLRKR